MSVLAPLFPGTSLEPLLEFSDAATLTDAVRREVDPHSGWRGSGRRFNDAAADQCPTKAARCILDRIGIRVAEYTPSAFEGRQRKHSVPFVPAPVTLWRCPLGECIPPEAFIGPCVGLLLQKGDHMSAATFCGCYWLHYDDLAPPAPCRVGCSLADALATLVALGWTVKTAVCTSLSLGRGGSDLCACGGVHPHPGPSHAAPRTFALGVVVLVVLALALALPGAAASVTLSRLIPRQPTIVRDRRYRRRMRRMFRSPRRKLLWYSAPHSLGRGTLLAGGCVHPHPGPSEQSAPGPFRPIDSVSGEEVNFIILPLRPLNAIVPVVFPVVEAQVFPPVLPPLPFNPPPRPRVAELRREAAAAAREELLEAGIIDAGFVDASGAIRVLDAEDLEMAREWFPVLRYHQERLGCPLDEVPRRYRMSKAARRARRAARRNAAVAPAADRPRTPPPAPSLPSSRSLPSSDDDDIPAPTVERCRARFFATCNVCSLNSIAKAQELADRCRNVDVCAVTEIWCPPPDVRAYLSQSWSCF